jgi:DNA helicase HerA-like ATPase
MYTPDGQLLIAQGQNPVYLLPKMCNRHGLITGATGTGKTVTLKAIAQSLSDAGVPVFLADVKGDVSGMAISGEASDKLMERLASLGISQLDFHESPVRFWDVYGEKGTPVRTTISEMGPVLLARLLGLTEVQEGVLNIVFHVADDKGMMLLDLKDLRAMLGWCGEHADELRIQYGNVSSASVGAIQRALLSLQDAGGDIFFGEPALELSDWIGVDEDGHGFVNILDAVRLVQSPLLYSTFLLWMLSELYESLPEVGDVALPKMVFFFDEAHLLFNDAPRALVQKVEQVVKLIRSKGVGVWFVTQSPTDIPATVLAQLNNRVQHALRAYTPAEQRAMRAAADSFRVNPSFDTEKAIGELATGEALLSFLDTQGVPGVVERAWVVAPGCSMGAAPADDQAYIVANSPFASKYTTMIDRESAYEMLNAVAIAAAKAAEEEAAAREKAATEAREEKERAAAEARAEREEARAAERAEREAAREAERLAREQAREAERAAREAERKAQQEAAAAKKEAERRQRQVESIGVSVARTAATSLTRGLLGSLKKGIFG